MLASGTTAPPFQLESSDGGTVSRDALAGKIAVLYFYPRDNTPGCTIEAQEFRDQLAAFKAAGAAVFGVSRDSIASHCKFRDKYGLTFPLLTDVDGAAMTRYQAWGDKVLYGKKITGVIRSTVVIDRDGKIARHWPKVVVKGHAAEVLAFVQSLGGGGRQGTGGAKGSSSSDGEEEQPRAPKAARPARAKASATKAPKPRRAPTRSAKKAPAKAAPKKAAPKKAAPKKAEPKKAAPKKAAPKKAAGNKRPAAAKPPRARGSARKAAGRARR
jgi:peroxiredoxin Q/BCP